MLPDSPLSPKAQRLLARILPRITRRLGQINTIPVAVLIWGPGIASSSQLAIVRLDLRTKLREQGHAAVFSEEICDPGLPFSIRIQQIAQAEEFDLVVSLPATSGSIAEVHDFAADRRISAKMLVFLNQEHLDGYSPKSLQAISTFVTCQIEYYPNESETVLIKQVTLDNVQRIREMKYILAGRHQL